MVAYAVWLERKISAFIQDRVGPNRVGPVRTAPAAGRWGEVVPQGRLHARTRAKGLFWLAPAIAIIPALLAMAVIPFGSKLGNQKMVIADLNVGILYTFGIVSLGVYGIVLAGYAANRSIRSSAAFVRARR